MKITIIHGQSHQGSTCHIARSLAENKPSVRTKVFFNVMRLMQKRGWNEADVNYWQAKGWTGKTRPW